MTYEAAAKGTIDVGSHAHGYTSGRFPLIQTTEFYGLSNSVTQIGHMLRTLYEDSTFTSEYKYSHLLFMYGAEFGSLHTTDKLFLTPKDLKSMGYAHQLPFYGCR